ncbi:hypothetical protein ACSBL2_22105 [Pedobacter sp. AW31-3R]|uniref:hypothetical protein n=1 Tax=Pedobacter sp. AW31-3R TaxID=3445781 RepID=UPI003FA0CA58
MITPEHNSLNNDDAEDQLSQQDVQSDGIDDLPASEADENASAIDHLSQADKAAESSFTLNVDGGIAPRKPDVD